MNIAKIFQKEQIKLFRKSQQGFILMDSIIGLVILITALVAIVAMYTQATKTTSFNRNYNNAVYIAQKSLEDIKQYENTPTIQFLPSTVTHPTNPTVDGVEYTVVITSPVTESLTNLYPYQVTVSWPASNPSTSINVVAYYR